MTNLEYFSEDLLKIWHSGNNFGVFNDAVTPVPCLPDVIACKNCRFYDGFCSDNRKNWLNSEYAEYETDWSKVPIDTRVQVICGSDIYPRYFAGLDDKGKPTYYKCGATSYSAKTVDNAIGNIYDDIQLYNAEDRFKYREEYPKCNLRNAE